MADRRHGRAGAKMGDDEIELVRGAPDMTCRGGERPGAARAVEAVAAYAVTLGDVARQRIGSRDGRHRSMEGRVEDCDLRHVGPGKTGCGDPLQIRRIVQWRQADIGCDHGADSFVDQHRP